MATKVKKAIRFSPAEQAVMSAFALAVKAGRKTLHRKDLMRVKSKYSAMKGGYECGTIKVTLTTLKNKGFLTSDGAGTWRLT